MDNQGNKRTGGWVWAIVGIAWSGLVYILFFINFIKNYLEYR
ncbi:MAG TPA: hypothetical protein VGB30_14140 [bacterium]